MRLNWKNANFRACLALIGVTFAFTYPLILKFNSCIPGFFSTDESYAALWDFWWLKYSFINHLSPAPQVAAPFAVASFQSGYPVWFWINKALSILTNNVLTYNLEVLLGFILSAVFMYLLALHLTKDKRSSFLAAVIFAFCPYHFARAWQHLGLSLTQWMPLYLLALFRLKESPGIKNSILTGIAFFLIAAFDFYYAYFMSIVSVIFLIYSVISAVRQRKSSPDQLKLMVKFLKMLVLVFLTVSILMLPALKTIFFAKSINVQKESTVFNVFSRPFEDLFPQSARPLSYFLPATVHPVFGKITEQFLGTQLYGDSLTEHALYLGWLPILLAFFAYKSWKKKRKTLAKGDSEYYYLVFFVFLAIASWLISQPPWWEIFGFKVYMPSFFLFSLLPMFRAYCRFGIILMLAVSILAAFGLREILARYRSKGAKNLVLFLAFLLVAFEFWNWPDYKVIDVSRAPAAYYWLSSQPGDFTVAEYPLDLNGSNELYKFFQTIHKRRIINGTTPGTYPNRVSKSIANLSDPETASKLKWMGVRYVLVHQESYLKSESVDQERELKKIPANQGLRLVNSFPGEKCSPEFPVCTRNNGPIDIYEITAKPLKPEAVN